MHPRRIDNDRLFHVTVRTRAPWRARLAAKRRQVESLWLVRFEKDTAERKLDDPRTMLLISPRGCRH